MRDRFARFGLGPSLLALLPCLAAFRPVEPGVPRPGAFPRAFDQQVPGEAAAPEDAQTAQPGVSTESDTSGQGSVSAESEVPTEPRPLEEERTTELDGLRGQLALERQRIEQLRQRAASAEGARAEVLDVRLGNAWRASIEASLEFASAVADQAEAGYDVSAYRADVTDALVAEMETARAALGLVDEGTQPAVEELGAAERAVHDRRLFEALDLVDAIQAGLMSSLEVARRLELNVGELEVWVQDELSDWAAEVSIMLEIAMRDASALKASLKAAPGEAPLVAKLTLAQARVKRCADDLARTAARMDDLDLDTAEYDEQVLSATGEITTDIFKVDVLGKLVGGWGKRVRSFFMEQGPGILFKLLLFVGILFVFRKLAKLVERLVQRGLSAANVHMSQLFQQMVIGMVGKIVMLLGVLIALSQLGISLGPLLAGLGIAGFVIGFALQDTLSNFASGLMILFYRPFDVGDVIEGGGVLGKVNRMSLVNTTLLTFDNQTVILPNNMIWQNLIKNVTGQRRRRVDLVFGVSYEDDVAQVEALLQEVLEANDKILADPEPQIHLHELADSSVNFVVRPWVKTEDYWDVYWDLMRAVKLRFDEEGISIPFPQRDVHLYPAAVAGADSVQPAPPPAGPSGGPSTGQASEPVETT